MHTVGTGFGIIWALLVMIAAVAVLGFWFWMLFDAITNKGLSTTEKVVWVIVILFLHLLGAIIYLLVARRRDSGNE